MKAVATAPICQAGKDRGWIRRKEGWQTIVLPGAGERAILLAMFAHSRPSDACLSQTNQSKYLLRREEMMDEGRGKEGRDNSQLLGRS